MRSSETLFEIPLKSKKIGIGFTGGSMPTDAGLVLLSQADDPAPIVVFVLVPRAARDLDDGLDVLALGHAAHPEENAKCKMQNAKCKSQNDR